MTSKKTGALAATQLARSDVVGWRSGVSISRIRRIGE